MKLLPRTYLFIFLLCILTNSCNKKSVRNNGSVDTQKNKTKFNSITPNNEKEQTDQNSFSVKKPKKDKTKSKENRYFATKKKKEQTDQNSFSATGKKKDKWWKLNINWRFWKKRLERRQKRKEDNTFNHSTKQDQKDKRRKKRKREMGLFPKEMRK